jgi:hypothetical protein
MDLEETKAMLDRARALLSATGASAFVVAHRFSRNGRDLELVLSARLMRVLKRERLQHSPRVHKALKNAGYGFDPENPRSESGRDGLFLLDRDHHPPNEMMRKLFDRYLDHGDAEDLVAFLGCSLADVLPVRLVSHHLRLLGVLQRKPACDVLALVDVDDTK